MVGEAPTPQLREFFVYLTNYCNCSCRHCWIVPGPASSGEKPRLSLSPQVFKAALCEGTPLGLSSLKWTGGEPTIHPHFQDLLRMQRDYGISGRLETNGMEITPALARLLVDCRTTRVAVSIDGACADTHDQIRQLPGAHRRALKGFGNLTEAGFKPQIIMTLMRSNFREVEALLDLARRCGAGSVKLNIVQPTLRGKELHDHGTASPLKELLQLERRLDQELRREFAFPIFLDIPPAFRSLTSMIKEKKLGACGVKSSLGLLADGSYALCGIGENVAAMVFGKAGNGELHRIWHKNPVILQLRENLPRKLRGICGRCLFKSLCQGTCVAQNYYRTADLFAPFWFCEAAVKEGLFPQNRLVSENS
jgi:SynChlorMet cassette radical SAM/SPASM protein ScmF